MENQMEDIAKLQFYAKTNEKNLRKKAAVLLGKIDDEKARDILIELTEDEDISVRYFAKRSLKQIDSKNTPKQNQKKEAKEVEPDTFMRAKLTQLYSPKKEERLNASKVIEEIGDSSVVPDIIEILNKEKEPVIISNLISIIGSLGNEDNIELLKNYLAPSFDSRVRANAVEAIGNIKQDNEIFQLIAPLIKDKNPRIVGNCAKILWNYSKEKTSILLNNMLKSENKNFVWSALYACGELPSLETRKLVIDVFKNPDLNYQLRAAKTLKKIDVALFDDLSILLLKKKELINLQLEHSVFQYLVDILLHHHIQDQIMAASILFIIAHPNDRNIEINVKQLLSNDEIDDKLKATLVKLLAKVAGNKELNFILSFLESKNERVIANTIEALEFIDDPRMVEILFSFLDNPNLRIRGNSIKILKKSFNTNLKEKIEELISSENEKENKVGLYILDEVGTEDDIATLTISAVHYKGDLLIHKNKVIKKLKLKSAKANKMVDDSDLERVKKAITKAFNMLTNPDFIVRKQGLEFLKSNMNLNTAHFYIERLENEKNPFLIATYLKLIGHCKKKEIFSIIKPYLNHKDNRVRENALKALQNIKNPEILTTVTPLLEDRDIRVRKSAAFLVWHMSNDREIKKLRSLLDSVENVLKTTVKKVLNEGLDENKIIPEITNREITNSEIKKDTNKIKYVLVGTSIFVIAIFLVFSFFAMNLINKFDEKINNNENKIISKINDIIGNKIKLVEKRLAENKSITPKQFEELKKSLNLSKKELEKIINKIQKKKKSIVIPIKKITPEIKITHKEKEILKQLIGYENEIKKLVANKDFKTARALIEESKKLDKNYPPILFQEGLMLVDENKLNEALKIFKYCNSKEKNVTEYVFSIADTFAKLGKEKEALLYYKKLTVIDPANIMNYIEAGKILLDQQNYEEAEIYFKKAEKLNPKSASIKTYLGIIYFNLGDFQNSKIIFNDLKKRGLEREIPYVYLGKIYLKDSLIDNAKEMFRNALGITPYSPEALLGLAKINYFSNDMDKARGYVEKILINDPKNVKAMLMLAKINKSMFTFDEAIRILKNAIEYDENYLDLYEELIPILKKKKKYQEAAEYITQYLAVLPEDEKIKRDNMQRLLFELENINKKTPVKTHHIKRKIRKTR